MTIEFSPSKELRSALIEQAEREMRLHEDREELANDDALRSGETSNGRAAW